jgi:hypothetical protein
MSKKGCGRRRRTPWRTIKKRRRARRIPASRDQVVPATKAQTDLPHKQDPETRQKGVNPAVGAVSAEQLMGPWIAPTIQGISVPLAVDTFCPENLISLKLAAQLGGDVKEGTSGNLAGLGGASLGVVGTTVLPIQLGMVLKNCEFKVVRDMDSFCFLGWREQ